MAWFNNLITNRMANIADQTFPQGTGRGFQTFDRPPLGSGLLGGTTLPTGSTAGRTGAGMLGSIAGALGAGTGPQAPTPGFQPRIPTPGGAGMGSSGAPGTTPTNTNVPPQGLLAMLQQMSGRAAGGGGDAQGIMSGGLNGGLSGANPLLGGVGGVLPGAAPGASPGGPVASGGLAGLLAALQNRNVTNANVNRTPGQQSVGTPT